MTTINATRVELPVEPRDHEGYLLAPHDIQVHVQGPAQVEAKVEKKGERVVVAFSTTLTGEYTVNLTHKGKHIQHSPLVVQVSPKQRDAEEPNVGPLPATKKTPVRFAVDPVDEKGNQISPSEKLVIECSGPDQVAPRVSREGGKILVEFETNIRRGTFSIGILHQGRHIHRSPFEVTVTPQDQDTRLEFDDLPVATLPSSSRIIQFTVKAKTKTLENILARDCVGEVIVGEDQKVEVKLENSGPNDLLISFHAFKAGKHKISVKKGGEEILGSPFKIEVPAEAIYGSS